MNKRADSLPKPPPFRKKPADQIAVAWKPRGGDAAQADLSHVAKAQPATKPRPTDCGALFWSWANPE